MSDQTIIVVIKRSGWYDGDVCHRLKKVQRIAELRGEHKIAKCAKRLRKEAKKLAAY